MAIPESVEKCANILILGIKGVGKSTFINAFPNYLHFPSIAEAETGNLCCSIPIEITAGDNNPTNAKQDTSRPNNVTQVKISPTQTTSAYTFQLSADRWVRLIDTPGYSSEHGINKDIVILEDILENIKQYEQLHAICIMCKPTSSSLTSYFKSFMAELINRLDDSISRNIILLFSNTKQSDYRIVQGLTRQDHIVIHCQSDKKVIIPLNFNTGSNSNVFCLFNTAFNGLISSKKYVKYDDIKMQHHSWHWSYTATLALIRYVFGGDNCEALTPYIMHDTGSTGEACRLINALYKPLADIIEFIKDNLMVLEHHKEKVIQHHPNGEELKMLLSIPSIDIKFARMEQPVTVCTSLKCSETYNLLGIKKYRYKHVCHKPCYLNSIPKEIMGSSELSKCPVFSSGMCQACGCDISTHMHIYYEFETYETIKDHDLQLNELQNESTTSKVVAQFKCLQDINSLSKLHLQHYYNILKGIAKFSSFLQNTLIDTCANDSYQTYLEYLIQREYTTGMGFSSCELVKRYMTLKNDYLEQKRLLETSNRAAISANDVFTIYEEICTLTPYGSQINELLELEKAGNKYEKIKLENISSTQPKLPVVQEQSNRSQVEDTEESVQKQLIVDLIIQNRFQSAKRQINILVDGKSSEHETNNSINERILSGFIAAHDFKAVNRYTQMIINEDHDNRSSVPTYKQLIIDLILEDNFKAANKLTQMVVDDERQTHKKIAADLIEKDAFTVANRYLQMLIEGDEESRENAEPGEETMAQKPKKKRKKRSKCMNRAKQNNLNNDQNASSNAIVTNNEPSTSENICPQPSSSHAYQENKYYVEIIDDSDPQLLPSPKKIKIEDLTDEI